MTASKRSQGRTPLVSSARRSDRGMKLPRREIEGKEPLIYFAKLIGRPNDVTIGRSDANLNSDDEPRLKAHTRAAGKVTWRRWARGPAEMETRLHQAFKDEQCPGEKEWFRRSSRLEAYLQGLQSSGYAHKDWRQAAIGPYLRYLPVTDADPGQLDIFGGQVQGGVIVDDLDDYQTPPLHVEGGRLVLRGVIDRDPATSVRANLEVVRARYINIAVIDCDERQDKRVSGDGLANPWDADGLPSNLFMNSPWSQDGIWAMKLREEYEAGRVRAAIMCVGDTSMSKTWWADFGAWPFAQPIGRPAFRQYDGVIAPPCGGIFVYLGPDEQRFHDVFSCLGHVYGSKKITQFQSKHARRFSPREQWDQKAVKEFWEEQSRRLKLGT